MSESHADAPGDADDSRTLRRRIVDEGRRAAYYAINPYEFATPEAGLWNFGHRDVPQPRISDDPVSSWPKGTAARIYSEGLRADLNATTPYEDSYTKTMIWRVGHKQMRMVTLYSTRPYRRYLLARDDCPPELRAAWEVRDPEDRSTAWIDNLPADARQRAHEYFRRLDAERRAKIDETAEDPGDD